MRHPMTVNVRRPRAVAIAATLPAQKATSRTNLVRWLAVLTALTLLAAAAPARAQVRDQADVFSPDAEQKAQQAIDQIQQKHKKRLLIESYAAVPAEKRAELQAKGTRQFFHDWALERGKAEKLDGVLVLLSLNPRSMRTQVFGADTQNRLFTQSDVSDMEKP